MTIRIVLADDHVVLRQALRALLEREPDIQVVAEADNGLEACDAVQEFRPDVVLMDLVMPVLDGVSATQRLHDKDAGVRVLILSSLEEDKAIVPVVRAGAIGFIRKSASIDVLVRSIRAAAQGQLQFSGVAAARLAQEVQSAIDQPEHLTPRELEVLDLVAQGRANKEIAWRLKISEKTVKSHVSAILSKFGLESRTQAALHASRMGLLPEERTAQATLQRLRGSHTPAQRDLEPFVLISRRAVLSPARSRA